MSEPYWEPFANAAGGAGGGTGAFHGVHATGSALQSISPATVTAVALADADTFDTDAYHDPATNNSRLTVPAGLGGYYWVGGWARWAQSTSGMYRRGQIRKNGSTNFFEDMDAPYSPGWQRSNPNGILALIAGDYIEMVVDHDGSAGSINLEANNAKSVLMMYLVGV